MVSIFRKVAEDYDFDQSAVSLLLPNDHFIYSQPSKDWDLFYSQAHGWRDDEYDNTSFYEELGNDGVVLFLLFLAEFQEGEDQ